MKVKYSNRSIPIADKQPHSCPILFTE